MPDCYKRYNKRAFVIEEWVAHIMKLYFFRHGIAEDGHELGDHDRKLTLRGRQRVERAAAVIAAMGVRPSRIFSSPRVRAQQTAEIVADVLRREVEIDEAVNFGFSLQSVRVLTNGLRDDAEVMFVGHEPSLSMTLKALTGGEIIMKKGGLARVDIVSRDPLHGELVWLIAPRVFEALSGSSDPDDD